MNKARYVFENHDERTIRYIASRSVNYCISSLIPYLRQPEALCYFSHRGGYAIEYNPYQYKSYHLFVAFNYSTVTNYSQRKSISRLLGKHISYCYDSVNTTTKRIII